MRWVFVLALALVLVLGAAAEIKAPGAAGGTNPYGSPPGLEPASTPAGLGCATVNASGYSVTIDTADAGIVGSEVNLTVSGFSTSGSVDVYLADEIGGELSAQLGLVDSGVAEPAQLTVHVPTNYGSPSFGHYAPGYYYFWAEDVASDCAASPAFQITAVPPASLYCSSSGFNSASLTVSPDDGTSATTVTLSVANFAPYGDVDIYISNPSASSDQYVTALASPGSSSGSYVPTGFSAGTYVFWGVDTYNDCAGAVFTLTSSGVNPAVTTTPEQAPAGGTFTVSGTGFTPSATAFFEFGAEFLEPTSCTTGSPAYDAIPTSSSGDFTCTFTVPWGSPAQTYLVQGEDSTTGATSPAAYFVVTTPSIAVAPPEGPIGTSYAVTASGFSVDSLAQLSFGYLVEVPTSCATGTFSGDQITTSSGGGFVCTFVVASDTEAGSIPVTGFDYGTSQPSNTVQFVVTVPSLALTTTVATVGTPFTVTGAGFSLGPADAVITLGGSDLVPVGGADCSYFGALIGLDASGGFECTFEVPAGTTLGATTIQGEDLSTGTLTATTGFSVVELTISTAPYSGPAGTSVTAFGAGWTPGDWIELGVGPVGGDEATNYTFCGANTWARVDSSGQFLCTFNFPSENLPPGPYDVFATDVSQFALPVSIANSSNFFTLQSPVSPPVPTIAVLPSATPAGGEFALNGSEFSLSNAPISVSLDGEDLVPTGGPDCTISNGAVVPDPNGNFLCDFEVPGLFAGGGPLLLQVTQAGATEDLTLTVPTLTVSTPFGPAGSGASTLAPYGLGPGELDAYDILPVLVTPGPDPSVAAVLVCNDLGLIDGSGWAAPSYYCGFTVPKISPGAYQLELVDPVTGALGVAGTPFTVTVAAVTVSPSLAAVGTSVTLSATGLAPSTEYSVCLDSSASPPPAYVCSSPVLAFVTSADGVFSGSFAVPSASTGEEFSVDLYQEVEVPGGSTAFPYVVSASPGLTVGIGLTFATGAAPAGPIGSVITLAGTGATPGDGDDLEFALTLSDSGSTTYYPVTCLSTPVIGTDGSFSCLFVLPSSLPADGEFIGADVYDTGTGDAGASTGDFLVDTPAAAITFDPPSGPAGTEVALTSSSGTLIPGYAGYAVYLVPTVAGGTPILLSNFASNLDGSLPLTPYPIPQGVTAGESYTLEVFQVVSGQDFFIVSAAGQFAVTLVSISGVSSTSGAPGLFGFTATGLDGVEYAVYVDTSQGVASSAAYNPIQPFSGGSEVTASADMPAGLGPGTYYVDIFEAPVSYLVAGQTLWTPPSFILTIFSFTLTTTLTLGAASGPVGSPLLVTGQGFTAGGSVVYKFDGTKQTPVFCSPGTFSGTTITANASGDFACIIPVPKLAAAPYTAVAVNLDPRFTTFAQPFTVTKPVIDVTPRQGPQFASIAITGTGFTPDSFLNSVTLGGVFLPQCSPPFGADFPFVETNGAGAFTCQANVPGSTVGSTIVATDVGGATASVKFDITIPRITLYQTRGPVGASVEILGTGFSALSPVDLTFLGTSGACASGSLTTSVEGTFSCYVDVPAGSTGSSVIATDVTGATATAKFTVTTPKISVSPKSGAVGTLVTISGSGFSELSALASLVFDGVPVTSGGTLQCTSGSLFTSSSGTLSCTITVPGGTSGTEVIATDVGGQSATAKFTVK